MIRKAKVTDIDRLLEITKSCAASMIAQNIFQWNEFYPNKKPFLNDFNRDELYVLDIDNKVMGCITISTLMDEEYIPIKWLTKNENNIYIHRLAVHPEVQGKGYAQKLMSFAENYAKTNHFTSVRLDTFSQNPRNVKFYETRGYKRLGDVFFPKQSEFPFHCYELVL
ncbi:GNAT family N-acetyltransferase [Neotamlana laminarinivorans]|uniref:GNAT family N-acetyltransferase n=1 Tax=Neotamlana laminarinivorans TaxID=2883124 RepID=A0A9X1I0Z9_9FLAO|nr:GNAT family N-acetyltransferase [Tamlana laminarinivorans]MCB4798197.1 GNAT family N-acetyltransferase [Tamlana laminarinivorans]